METTPSDTWATGSCLCDTVRYSLIQTPKSIEKYVCHCVLCKKASGSAFMTNWWMSDDVTAGEENIGKVVIRTTDSGYPVTRSFCKSCGSPLFLTSTNPNMTGEIGITAGTIDWDSKLPSQQNAALNWVPDAELYTVDRLTTLSEIPGCKQIPTLKKS